MTAETVKLQTPQFDARFPNTTQVCTRAPPPPSEAVQRTLIARVRPSVRVCVCVGTDKELLAELGRLPQVRGGTRRRLPRVPKVSEDVQVALPQRMGASHGAPRTVQGAVVQE
jgi:hypothetical protein